MQHICDFIFLKTFVRMQHPKTKFKFKSSCVRVLVWSMFMAFLQSFIREPPEVNCNEIHVKKLCYCQITNFSWSSTILVSWCQRNLSIGSLILCHTVSSGRAMSSCEPLVSCIRRVWFTELWYCSSLTSCQFPQMLKNQSMKILKHHNGLWNE